MKILKKIFDLMPNQQQFLLRCYKMFQTGGKGSWWVFKNMRAAIIAPFLINKPIKNLNLFEKRIYSQNGEDGILKAIFDKIGTTNKFCIEFGIEAIEGNTVYWQKKGWDFLWMDGNGDGKIVKKEFVTAENINQLFRKYKVPKEFDLLSIDIDFNDYWVWKALSDYHPRVVVIEYNAIIPPTESKVVKYDPHFEGYQKVNYEGSNYFGASLLAYKKLGLAKGYTLVACDNFGTNAFFVRNDLIDNNLILIKNIEEIYRPPVRYGHHPSDKQMIEV